MSKQLEVQIMGQSYLLGCPDGGEQQLLEAVERVDTAMCRIRDSGKIKARDRIAVLAALNLAADLGERPVTAPAAPATVPAASPVRASGSTANDTEDDPRLSALLERLDTAFRSDGQLL